MGLTSSKENQEQERQNREKIYVRNAKQLVGGDDDYFATTLNIDDLNTEQPTKNKPVLPNINRNINGGSVGFESRRNRYDQFNVFDIINNYEKEMKGGDPNAEQVLVEQAPAEQISAEQIPVVQVKEEVVDVSVNQTSDEALDKVRNAILERLNDLGKNLNPEAKVGGGSCGCENRAVNDSKTGGSTNLLATGPQTKLYQDASDSSSTTSTSSASTTSSHTSSSEVGRKKKTSKSKSTKRSTKFDIEESSESFILDTSETGTEPELKPRGRRNKRVVHDTSNGDSSSSSSSSNSNSESNSSDDSEEGLSIFPFNSSDVKSSVSSQNFKTLRRRV